MRTRLLILALLCGCALAAPATASAQSVTVSSPTPVAEGHADTTPINFTLELTGSAVPLTFDLSTEDVTTTSADHGAPPTSIDLPPDTPTTVTVEVNGDVLDELSPETFKLKASGPLGLIHGEGVGSIDDDDDFPSVEIGDVAVTEGSSGSPVAEVPITLTGPSGQPGGVTLNYTTQPGSAVAPDDYTETTGPPVTFAEGETSKTVSVPIVPDTVDEPNEAFTLKGTGVGNADLAPDELGFGFILDDDVTPANLPPIARIAVNPQRAFVGKVVEFNGSQSSDPEGPVRSYEWDLDGNGSFETPTGNDPILLYAFLMPGTQFVGLQVTDQGGRKDSERAAAEIFPAPAGFGQDTTPPSTKLLGARRNLRTALRRGLRARLRCSEACLIAGSVGVDRRTGRRLGLRGRNRTMGRAFGATTKAGSKVLTFKLSRKARRALAEVKRARVTLRFTVRDASQNKRVTNHKITLRR